MKFTIEDITPAKAKKYLEKNTCNRKLRPMHIKVMSNDMTAGRWGESPQGIAFANDGADEVLIDGQNRLYAIIDSGVTVKMVVTRGLKKEAMDVIDIGAKRSIADTLHLTDGLINCNLSAAAARQIIVLCFGFQNYSVSIGLTRVVLDYFGEEIQEVIKYTSHLKPAKKSWIVAALAFGMKSEKSIREFSNSVGTGESLAKGSPALAVRNWLISDSSEVLKTTYSAGRYECIFNAMYHHAMGNTMLKPSRGVTGINHFRSKQRKFIETIRPEVSRLR